MAENSTTEPLLVRTAGFNDNFVVGDIKVTREPTEVTEAQAKALVEATQMPGNKSVVLEFSRPAVKEVKK
jgi:hypothetical protein